MPRLLLHPLMPGADEHYGSLRLVDDIGVAKIRSRLLGFQEVPGERACLALEEIAQARVDGREAAEIGAERHLQRRQIRGRQIGA